MKAGLDKVIIIGDGIGGLTAALALHKKGFQVEVYEKADQLKEIDATLTLWPNAGKVLKKFGLLNDTQKKGAELSKIILKSNSGKVLREEAISGYEVPAIAILRSELYNIILSCLPGGMVHSGKDFIKYKNENNIIQAEFSDGSTASASLLIGADGLNSRVREQMKRDGKPVFRGYNIWRGIAEFSHKDAETGATCEFMGKGKRFGIVPLGNGKIGWWATANESITNPPRLEGRKKKLKSKFRNWPSPISQLIDSTPDDNIIKVSAFDRLPVNGWHEGRAVLLGDAAHPATPDRGQGACMSIEDAWVLSELIDKESNFETALNRYEELRYPRTSVITNQSLKHGEIGQWTNSFAVAARNLYIKYLPAAKTKKIIDEMFEFDVR